MVTEAKLKVMKLNNDLGPLCLLEIVSGLITVSSQWWR